MKVICAPDKFKGSLIAAAAAGAMARGIRRACPGAQMDLCPVADGGEGFAAALTAALHGRSIITPVDGPLGEPVDATWGQADDVSTGRRIAVLEMAAAAGLQNLPIDRRDPTRTTTFGVGQLIATALDSQVDEILLGIGGSATTDGGCGAAQALGVRFLDDHDLLIDRPIAGADLRHIRHIDLSARHPRLATVRLRVACDVENPLHGPDGAARVYAPQKGATSAQVDLLDAGLKHLAQVIRRAVNLDVQTLPGAGAAGGLGAGLVAFLGARLEPGIGLVLDAVHFESRVRGCDLCLTGEGRLDGQSASGKAVIGVARAAAAMGVPTIALAGALGPGVERTLAAGLHAYRCINPGLPADESMRRTEELLENAAAECVTAWLR